MDAQDESNQFNRLFQNLPAELFRDIEEMVFPLESPPENRVIINREYKPPWQLEIDRASRRQVALEYYSQHTFVFRSMEAKPKHEQPPRLQTVVCTSVADEQHLQAWIKSLSDEHRLAINAIVIEVTNKPFTHRVCPRIMRVKDIAASTLRRRLANEGLKLKQGALRVRFRVKLIDGTIHTIYGVS